MTILAAILLAGAILVLRRQLATILAYAALGLALYALWRFAPFLGVAQRWILTGYGGTLLAIIFGPPLAYRLIVRWHVNQDRRRAHTKIDEDMDRRMP